MSPPLEKFQLRFLDDLTRLLAEGGFVASYKYALLLALADLSVEYGDDDQKELTLTTSQIAEKFISAYWRQSAPYSSRGRNTPARVLHQNTGRQAAIVKAVTLSFDRAEGSLAKLRSNHRTYNALVLRVSRKVEEMPLWKLQTIGTERTDFLYDNLDAGSRITLKRGVAFCFRRFYLLIHDLITGAWLRFVRSLRQNQDLLGQSTDLAEFLFGSERADLSTFEVILNDFQSGRCFYCTRGVGKRAEVDHFIPWSRYPVDLGHNFVLADENCNRKKSDRLAAIDHLARWCERNDKEGRALEEAFDQKHLIHSLPATRRVASWAYAQAESANAELWLAGNEMVPLVRGWRTTILQGAYSAKIFNAPKDGSRR